MYATHVCLWCVVCGMHIGHMCLETGKEVLRLLDPNLACHKLVEVRSEG